MANRFFSPEQQFFLNPTTGSPLAGGKLFFYATGSSTKQNTYSDSALTIANLNPIILDSNGQAGSVFLQNLAYKVVLAPSTDTDPPSAPIWSMDPVWSSDFSTIAQVQVVNGNPNGQLAGTAGTLGGLPSSTAWDATNNILYICTQTGSTSTAVWTAVNPASSTGSTLVGVPQGYLTLTSATPIIAGDVTSATQVIYTPYLGTQVPIYTGTAFTIQSFTELTLNLNNPNHVASTLYDMFIFNNSGVLTLVTGPAWSGSGGGSSSRGTGAGTTQLAKTLGIWTNAVSMTARNGSTTYTVGANLGTYLGTIFIDGTAGQVSCYRSWGQNRKWGVWNAYNRVPIRVQCGDSTASWTYNSGTIRASNGTSANSIATLTGLAEEVIDIIFIQAVRITPTANNQAQIGIGVNSTTTYGGTEGNIFSNVTTGATQATVTAYANVSPGTLGFNSITANEAVPTPAGTAATFFGTQTNMTLVAEWRG